MRAMWVCVWAISFLMMPESWCNVAVPQATEEAMRFYRTGNWLWIVQQLVPILVFLGMIVSGFSVALRNKVKMLSKNRTLQIVSYFVVFGLVYFIITFPLMYYADYVRLHDYGLSTQPFGKWLGDAMKSAAISLAVGIVLVLVLYALINKSPKRWWFYASLLTLPFIIFAILVTPIWIEPLFNKFGPMKDKVLEAQILHLADCAGIEGSRVYEVDKSADTNMLNAYVAGFGGTKRIVLWDTIIAKLTPEELLFVMGHEMGHFVLHHIEKDIAFQFALSFLLFLFLSTGAVIVKRYKNKLHMESLSDIATLPLLLVMVHLFFLVTTPLSNAFSRYMEHQADGFGLEITQNNKAAAQAFVKLQERNLANPTPGSLFVFWRATHPPLSERIEYCNTYMPWKEGKPLEFRSYIKKECQPLSGRK